MEGNKLLTRFLSLLIVVLALSSCGDDRIFEDYRGMKQLQWSIADTVRFELEAQPAKSKLIIAVKYTDDYDFRNLYVRYLLKDSSALVLENTLVNIPLFERTSGKPLGKGFGTTYTKYDTLPIQTESDIHVVDFIQYMRVESLNGVEAIGLKVIPSRQ